MSLRTPLGQVLGHGSAKDGTSHFWGQRVFGVALVLLGLWFVACMLSMPSFQYADVLAFMAVPLNGVLLLLLVSAMAYHSSLGVQVVIEDYVHAHAMKLALLIISRFTHTILAVAAIYAIIKVGLSA